MSKTTALRERARADEGNLLGREKSPYLLQHADNPVHWRPWSPAAFEEARRLDKPVFVSVGYSTCHWCHVMAHESFEDEAVARLLNDAFVCVKVDREERPDVDGFFMDFALAMTGSGGWPLTVVTTPDGKPFFAGTYFPKESRQGRVGMLDLIPRLQTLWRGKRDDLERSAADMVSRLEAGVRAAAGAGPTEETLKKAVDQLEARYDAVHGGFGSATKFPSPHGLVFLLRRGRETGNARATDMALATLRAMRRGGIHDALGFGFHRYATDPAWLLPHFEKMLYDQAGLALAYLEAFQATGDEEFAETARGIFAYVLRDLRSPEGAFYSAEDADSEGEEGRFYVWTRAELLAALGPEDGAFAARVYGATDEGNVREEATGQRTGANVLHLAEPPESPGERARLERVRRVLYDARAKRPRPFRDTKILTDWNGFMIAALARGARILGDGEYEAAARRAADFLLDRMATADGGLWHRHKDGESGIAGTLDDTAFLSWGLIELYQAAFEPRYLGEAIRLTRAMVDRFGDGEEGGFFLARDGASDLPVRRKESQDGALPSGNSVAMANLFVLGRVTGDAVLEAHAAGVGKAFSRDLEAAPAGFTHMLAAADLMLGSFAEAVVVGNAGAADTEELLGALRSAWDPRVFACFRPAGESGAALTAMAPSTEFYDMVGGKAAAYLCRDFACSRPATDAAAFLEVLAE